MTDIPTSLLVAAVALIDGEGRVLMQRRPDGAQHGGLWEFPGGKIEPGEAPELAALREIGEELGVAIPDRALAPCSFSSADLPAGSRHSRVVILLYTARDWQGDPHPREGQTLAWVAPQDIAGLAMPPADYPLARDLCAMLGVG